MSLSEAIATVTVCQGPPACLYEGDEAVAEANRGCLWCEKITLYADGSEAIEKPHES